ncbi:hypothetical protein HNP02_008520 [Mycobacterium sp. AZCC_0083]|nr:hypothetical protein [Mycobacterium sp. AZCC_0083]
MICEGVASYLPDIDPEETTEWLESFDELLERSGPARARYLMLRLLERSSEQRVAIPALTSTDYVNTIPAELEPWFPGDEDVERRYRAWIRWNAAIMVHRAQRPGVGVGGHISTYASSVALYVVGFNHFLRGKSHPGGGDQIFIQGHASPRHLRARVGSWTSALWGDRARSRCRSPHAEIRAPGTEQPARTGLDRGSSAVVRSSLKASSMGRCGDPDWPDRHAERRP